MIYRKGAFPFPVPTLSTGDYAAVAQLYPVAVPLSQLAKWYWGIKSVSLASSTNFSGADINGTNYVGNDAFSMDVPDSVTLGPSYNAGGLPNADFTLAHSKPQQRILDPTPLGFSALIGSSLIQMQPVAMGAGSVANDFVPPQHQTYDVGYQIAIFASNQFAPPFYPVIKVGAGYFPSVAIFSGGGGSGVLGVGYATNTVQFGGSLPASPFIFDGIAIPMFYLLEGIATSPMFSNSATLVVTSYWDLTI